MEIVKKNLTAKWADENQTRVAVFRGSLHIANVCGSMERGLTSLKTTLNGRQRTM